MRHRTYAQAINEATDLCLSRDRFVFVIGEGVPDKKGIFGTTLGLVEKYGSDRVMDMPVCENGMTGVCIGTALRGMRPVLVHARVDFSLLSFDQIVNNAAKWFYMFGGKKPVPLVIRMLIGKGWGQGAQHSQSLVSLFAHIPGLKVVMPTTAYDAKGMLIASILDNNPVIFIEHRWLHNIKGEVPEKFYTTDLDKAKVVKKGKDITLVSYSYMTLECLRAAEILEKQGISVEIVDLRSLKPLDIKTVIKSVAKTKRVIVCDLCHKSYGIAPEVITGIVENSNVLLKSPPARIALPDIPTPTSWVLAEKYYPTYLDIVRKTLEMLKTPDKKIQKILQSNRRDKSIKSDVPDNTFTGPF